MSEDVDPNALALVVCAAPLAERCHEIAAYLVTAGYSVTVTTTPKAREWVDGDAIEAATSHLADRPPRRPGERRTTRKPGHVVVAPLTFNTLNMWAVGANSNAALGILNDTFGTSARALAVPMIGDRLWAHPAVAGHVDTLRAAGVTFIDVQTGRQGLHRLVSGTAPELATAFDAAWLVPFLAPARV